MTSRSRIKLQTLLEARDSLKWFLDAIANGELTAGPGLRARLEGAVAALGELITLAPERPGEGVGSGLRRKSDSTRGARDGLCRVAEAIRSGILTASPVYLARVEGAAAALDALLASRGLKS